MVLVIMICHLATCDRISQPVDNCIMSGQMAQVMLARTTLLQPGDKITIKCGKDGSL